jgi:hypothetical protein
VGEAFPHELPAFAVMGPPRPRGVAYEFAGPIRGGP